MTTRRTRNPQDKQRRLIDAALVEFAEHGPAATRIDAIAERAGVNKQLIYHYFGSKEALWNEVLVAFTSRFDEAADSPPADLGDRFSLFFNQSNHDRGYTRLLEWEALTTDPVEIANAGDRRDQLRDFTVSLAVDVAEGRLPDDTDTEQLALTIIAAAAFAQAFPQFVQLLTGHAPEHPAFIEARSRHMHWLGSHLTQKATTAP
jgi:TetR/AcrR family transcriptional regulator